MATSLTKDFLVPFLTPSDKEFRTFLQKMVVGITGIEGALVRPRFQVNPPKQPDVQIDWCAFGIVNTNADVNSDLKVDSDGLGSTLIKNEAIQLLATFYGPNAYGYASMLRDGLEVEQNLYVLAENGIKLTRAVEIVHLPEQINDLWYDRRDLTVELVREVRRVYNVLSFVSASGFIITDNIDPIIVPFGVIEPTDYGDVLWTGEDLFAVDVQEDLLEIGEEEPDVLSLGSGAILSVDENNEVLEPT